MKLEVVASMYYLILILCCTEKQYIELRYFMIISDHFMFPYNFNVHLNFFFAFISNAFFFT